MQFCEFNIVDVKSKGKLLQFATLNYKKDLPIKSDTL